MDKYTATEMAYKNGYEKGYAAAKAEIVNCGECVHNGCWAQWWIMQDAPDDSIPDEYFCPFGERKPEFSKQTMDALKKMGEKVHGGNDG